MEMVRGRSGEEAEAGEEVAALGSGGDGSRAAAALGRRRRLQQQR